MSAYRDEVKPSSNVGKVVVLLLGLTLLIVLIGLRLFSSDGMDEMVEGMIETIAPTAVAPTIAPTPELIVEPVPTVDNLLAPSIEGAIISPSENGDQLNLSGSADIACTELVGFLDGLEVGRTTPTASGTWALSVPAPAAVEYDAVMKCVTSDGEFSADPIQIKVPENIASIDEPATDESATDEPTTDEPTTDDPTTDDPTTDDPTTDDPTTDDPTTDEAVTNGEEEIAESPDPAVVTDTVESAPVVTDTVEATPLPAPSFDQPDFTFANKMDEWVGGALLVRGSAEANSDVELVFDNGVQPVTATAISNDEGRFAARVILTEVGDYAVTVQYAGSQAEPSETVVVPPDVNFGGPGNCVGTVPPFGTIEGDVYIVNSCEYFSLIANRLGVSYRDLLEVNRNILNPNNLRAGDRIQIPPLP